jgi:hypothetical protein
MQAAGGSRPFAISITAAILALTHETKHLIMATADAVAILAALWTAPTLKFDRFPTFWSRLPQPCAFSRCLECAAVCRRRTLKRRRRAADADRRTCRTISAVAEGLISLT